MSANEEDIKPDPVNSQPDLSSPNDKRTKPTTGSNTEHSHETENKTKTKTTTKAKTSLSTGGSNGKWTPEKRERLIEMLLAAGIKAFNVLRFRLRP
jgi:hypothetical protein